MNHIKKLLLVISGLVLTSLGIKLLSDNLLTFGGTAGIATVLTYYTNMSWGTLFLIVNLPFFIISIRELGTWFSISSLFSIMGISIFREWLDLAVPAFELNSVLAVILAGLLIGFGVTFVLNNGSSLGGIHILGLYADKKLGINRGFALFVCDSLIIILAIMLVGLINALLSICSIFIASLLIGRYKKSPIKVMQADQNEQPSGQGIRSSL